MKGLTQKEDNKKQNNTNTGLVRSSPASANKSYLVGAPTDRLLSIVRDGGHPSSMYTGLRQQAVMNLQRTIGNQAVQRLIKSGALQAKLKISRSGDRYEQEADRVAEQVMRLPEVQRQPEEEEEELIQAKEASVRTPDVTLNMETRLNALRGRSQPLSEGTKSFMERRFGSDFSGVRVHTDSNAAETAKAVNAKAFTVGRDIVFGAGQYAPEKTDGGKLLSHELTHVIQQSAVRYMSPTGSRIAPVQSRFGYGAIQLQAKSDEPEIEKLSGKLDRFTLLMKATLALAEAMRVVPPGDKFFEGQKHLSRLAKDVGGLKRMLDKAPQDKQAAVSKLNKIIHRSKIIVEMGRRSEEVMAPDDVTQGPDAYTCPTTRVEPCGERIKWERKSPVPIDLSAGNLVDFVNKVSQLFNNNTAAHMTPSWVIEPDVDRNSGRVTNVNLSLETTIIRPRLGMSRAKGDDRRLINRVVQFMKNHEKCHRDIAYNTCQEAVCKARGKRSNEADRILRTELCETMPSRQEALDASEGNIEWIKNNEGTRIIDFKPVGVEANYHDPACR